MQASVLSPPMFIEHDPQIPGGRETPVLWWTSPNTLTRQPLTFSAGTSEGQSGVNLVLYLDECVQDHGAASVHVHFVLLHARLVPRLIRVLNNNQKQYHSIAT